MVELGGQLKAQTPGSAGVNSWEAKAVALLRAQAALPHQHQLDLEATEHVSWCLRT